MGFDPKHKASNIATDKEILTSIREGGKARREVIDSFFNAHMGMMHTIKTKLNLSSEAIKDAYADSISTIIWNIDTQVFKGDSKLSTYLYKILYNKSVDLLRHSSTYKNEAYLELIDDTPHDASADISRQLESQLDFEKIKQEILQLGNPCNAIILDWAYWGYSMAEIATRNGIDSADKVKKKKYSCLQKLRSLLKSKGIE